MRGSVPDAVVRRAKLLMLVGLGLLGCRDSGPERLPPQAVIAAPEPSAADFDAYAAGTAVEIRMARRALQAGKTVRWFAVESAGAAAVGLPLERYRAMTAAVETALKQPVATTSETRGLDSLRVDLMLLRVRAEGMP
jgi:predicted small lipoprotein YifL